MSLLFEGVVKKEADSGGHEQEPNYCCVVEEEFSEEDEDLGKFVSHQLKC